LHCVLVALESFPQQLGADLEIDRDVLPGVLALLQVALPGEERVRPAAHRVLVAAELLHGKARHPVVVMPIFHRYAFPVLIFRELEKQFSNYGIVAVAENVGLDFHRLAQNTLYGVAAAVHLRADRFDHDPRRRWRGVIAA
jgi:hypothetical protein